MSASGESAESEAGSTGGTSGSSGGSSVSRGQSDAGAVGEAEAVADSEAVGDAESSSVGESDTSSVGQSQVRSAAIESTEPTNTSCAPACTSPILPTHTIIPPLLPCLASLSMFSVRRCTRKQSGASVNVFSRR